MLRGFSKWLLCYNSCVIIISDDWFIASRLFSKNSARGPPPWRACLVDNGCWCNWSEGRGRGSSPAIHQRVDVVSVSAVSGQSTLLFTTQSTNNNLGCITTSDVADSSWQLINLSRWKIITPLYIPVRTKCSYFLYSSALCLSKLNYTYKTLLKTRDIVLMLLLRLTKHFKWSSRLFCVTRCYT